MKKIGLLVLAMLVGSSTLFTACSRTARDDANVAEMENGQVVEMEGPQDQYGWFPHLRLTFDGDVLTQVYFDYIDDEAAKKSQDEEYNSTMQEKTGMSAKDAMETLRANLLETQDPTKVDIVAGATQTSTEFIELARQAFDNYFSGKTSANNYGEDNNTLGISDPAQNTEGQGASSQGEADTTGNTGQGTQTGQTGNTGSTTEAGGSNQEPTSPYTTGGDGNPNSQSGGNSSQSSTSGGGEGGGGNTN